MGQIISAGINQATSLATQGMNMRLQRETNANNLQIARETNQANAELAGRQNEWNLLQWARENAYNDPSAQVQRLKGAGLSAAAAAQSIEGAGNAQPLQSADLANQQMPNPSQAPTFDFSGLSASNIIGVARELEALRKDKVEANVAEQSQGAQIENVLTDTDVKKAALKLTLQDIQFRAEQQPYSLQALKYHAQGMQYFPEIQRTLKDYQEENYKLAQQQYGFLEQYNPEKLREIGETINKIIAEAEKERAEKRQADAMTANINQDTKNKGEEFKGIVLRNFGQVIQNALGKAGFPEDNAQKFGALVRDGVLKPSDIPEYLIASRSYVVSGGQFFNGSPDLRNVFIHTLNPGIGEGYKVPVWSHGTLFRPLDFFRRSFGSDYGKPTQYAP